MKKFLIYTILAYFALSIQALFFSGTKPDFVLVLVCFYALGHEPSKGIAYGAFTGLLLDSASGFILGPNIISKSFAAFLVRTIRGNIFQWNIFVCTLMIALLSVIDILIVSTCLRVFSDISVTNRSWELFWWGCVYTVLSAIVLYKALKPEEDDIITMSQRVHE